jgi:hypothetical protein
MKDESMSMEHWWDDIGKQKFWEKNNVQRQW